MSLYYFSLHNTRRLIPDSEGTELADDQAAREYAAVVAREVMRNDPHRMLAWRVQVCDAQRRLCFNLLFASVSPELEQYSPEFRELVERKSQSMATLADDILEVRHSLQQMRATLARVDRMPYLAAVNGRRLDAAG